MRCGAEEEGPQRFGPVGDALDHSNQRPAHGRVGAVGGAQVHADGGLPHQADSDLDLPAPQDARTANRFSVHLLGTFRCGWGKASEPWRDLARRTSRNWSGESGSEWRCAAILWSSGGVSFSETW